MDASALLQRQGWRGTGHSLDASNRGIAKPLLISHKQDQLGLGKKKAAHMADDQWWMRAFDESLKNIGTGGNGGGGTKSTLTQVREKGINRGGLYGFFVRGEGLKGTVGVVDEEVRTVGVVEGEGKGKMGEGKKRKRKDDDEEDNKAAEATTDKQKKKKVKKTDNKKAKKSATTTTDTHTDKPTQTPIGPLSPPETSTLRTFLKRAEKSLHLTIRSQEKKGTYGVFGARATKAVKAARKKAAEEAFKSLRKEKIVAAMVKGDIPNPHNWDEGELKGTKWRDVERTCNVVLASREGTDLGKLFGLGDVGGVSSSSEATTETGTPAEVSRAEKNGKKKDKKSKSSSSKSSSRQSATTSDSEDKYDSGDAAPTISDLAVAAKLAKLSEQEREVYTVRAASKGQSLETYVARRIVKKNEKAAKSKKKADGGKTKKK